MELSGLFCMYLPGPFGAMGACLCGCFWRPSFGAVGDSGDRSIYEKLGESFSDFSKRAL